MSSLDRFPYLLLIALIMIPGPVIFAVTLGSAWWQFVLAPFVGPFVGYVFAYTILRDLKLSSNATWGQVKLAKAKLAMKAPDASAP